MRLRLDKLVLSAGLALAMVATSIPAIAGTPTTSTQESEGLSLNGKTVSIVKQDDKFVFLNEEDKFAFAKAQKGVEVGGAAEAVTGVEGYVGKISSIEVVSTKEKATSVNTGGAGESINNKCISDGVDLTSGVSLPGYKITVTNIY